MIDFTSNVRPESMERIVNFDLANAFIEEAVAAVRAQVGDKKVLLALSGGVDSSVVAALLIKAIGRQLVSVHVIPRPHSEVEFILPSLDNCDRQ